MLTVVRAVYAAWVANLYHLVRKYAYVIIVGPILTKYCKNGNPLGTTSKTWPRITCKMEAKITMGPRDDALIYIYTHIYTFL